MITTQISIMAFYAARIILYMLAAISVLVIGLFIERLFFFIRKLTRNGRDLLRELEDADTKEDVKKVLKANPASETWVVLMGLSGKVEGKEAFREKVHSVLIQERSSWERFSAFLGSVGSNAPFVGLLGTVLGIMKAFADLGAAGKGGPQVVMGGISEALIATAVGLAVAIPAIIFFNICKTRAKKSGSLVESMVSLICSKGIL